MKKVKCIKLKSAVACLCISLCLASVGLATEVDTNLKQDADITSEVKELSNNADEIDNGIGNLDYNRKTVLAVDGESVESFVPKEGTVDGDKFIVVTREKKSLTTSPVDISIIDSINDRTYPGALQFANEAFLENRPDILVCKRKPLNISIDLPGMKKENTTVVENPTYGNISGAIDSLVSKWDSEYSDSHTLPTRTQYSESMVYSKSQIAATLNVNAKVLDGSLGIDFQAITSGEKKVMIAAYKQIFYTVSAELPNNPSDLFDESVTFDELKRKGVDSLNPPLMVSNVAYGRTIYVKLETTSNNEDVQAAFQTLLKNTDVKASAKYKNIFDQSSFTAVVLGGDSKEHNKVITKDFDEIRDVIKNNAEFSSSNPAYPISYTSVFVKDNSIAAVKNRTEYVETNYTQYSKGQINVDHSGAYVAQFDISWDEFSYDENGDEVLVHKTWDQNWDDKTAHFSSIIPLKPNTKNIRIYARECTGLAWEWWRDVINEYNVPLTNKIDVSMGGTTLYPSGGVSY